MSRRNRTRGFAALELALLTPVVLLIIELIVAGGRITQAQSIVDEAAHSGARAASQALTMTAARSVAVSVALQSLDSAASACTNPTVSVDLGNFRAGGSVAVNVTCDSSLRDLTLLPLPGIHRESARVQSSIDLYGGG